MSEKEAGNHLDALKAIRSHGEIVDRIRKSLYYGKNKGAKEVMECPSMPLTEVTVELFEKALKSKKSKKTCGSFSKELKSRPSTLDMAYASSVTKNACISPCAVVLALIYLERLRQQNPDYLNSASECDLFLVSMMVASKYLFDDGEDEEVFNDEWAVSGEIDLKTLNKLEVEFLSAIDWRLYVKPNDFVKKLTTVEILVTWKETRKRSDGQFTYHDIVSLESNLDWSKFSENVLNTIAITFLSYSAILVSLIGLSLVVHAVHGHVPLTPTPTYLVSNISQEMTNRQATRLPELSCYLPEISCSSHTKNSVNHGFKPSSALSEVNTAYKKVPTFRPVPALS